MADLMVLGADGSVRTSGWTFHGRDRQKAEPAAAARSALQGQNTILAAIRATSDRHATNRGLSMSGLSPSDWHVLFQALIEAESGYKPNAVSPKGAYGLGQLMPGTAHGLGVDRMDISQNLEGAARYLLVQLAEFRNVDLALAAYNAGPHRVREHGGVPPFSETREYIARIHRIRARLSGNSAPRPPVQIASSALTRLPLVIDLN